MTYYIERKIAEIIEPDFQKLVTELCQCVDLDRGQFENKTLANLFTAIVAEGKKLNLKKVLVCQILDQKVKHLALDSVVGGVCCELTNRKGKPMDDFAGKSVFTLIKQCYTAVCPPRPRPQRPSRLQKRHQFETKLILRRRRNGSY